jgi:hypothetical protein
MADNRLSALTNVTLHEANRAARTKKQGGQMTLEVAEAGIRGFISRRASLT